jgi:hypothetical protein
MTATLDLLLQPVAGAPAGQLARALSRPRTRPTGPGSSLWGSLGRNVGKIGLLAKGVISASVDQGEFPPVAAQQEPGSDGSPDQAKSRALEGPGRIPACSPSYHA